MASTDPHPYCGQFVWSAKHNRYGWKSFLGVEPGGVELPPYTAAARTEDLSRLPPAFIMVGALDLLLEESVDDGMRLLRAGVPTELHVLPGAFHGLDIVSDAPISRTAHDMRLAALRIALRC